MPALTPQPRWHDDLALVSSLSRHPSSLKRGQQLQQHPQSDAPLKLSVSQLCLHQTTSQESQCQRVADTNADCALTPADELILTELRYLRRVRLLQLHYYPRLKAALPSGSSLADQLASIFAVFGTFRELHRRLLADLQAAEFSRESLIGRVMRQFAQTLTLYSDYYVNYKRHLQLVNDCLRDRQDFRAACLAAMRDCPDPRDRKLDLTSHMTEPIQRPLRYRLLIDAYMKKLDHGHPDFVDASAALEVIDRVTADFNNRIAELEAFQRMLVELRDLTFPEELASARDAFAQSTFMLSSRVTKISSKNREQSRHLLLSSAWLLFCHVGPFNSRTVLRAVQLGSDDLTVFVDKKLLADYPNSLRLRTSGKSYDVAFGSAAEFQRWLTALAADLRLPVVETGVAGCDGEVFPWVAVPEGELGRRQPAKVKDGDVSQCQACSTVFTFSLRRHHCRVCGGVYCHGCSRYQTRVLWSNKEKRTCLFCKDRMCRRDSTTGILLASHRDAIHRFHRNESDRLSQFLGQGPVPIVEGYLNVRIDVPHLRRVDCPPYLRGQWCRLWCTADGHVMRLHRMKRDPNPVHLLVLPLELGVTWSDPGVEIRLLVKGGQLETCRLRRCPDAAGGGSLQDWHRCLRAAAESLTRAASATVGRGSLQFELPTGY